MTPNLNSSPLATLLGSAQTPVQSRDSAPVLLAQGPTGDPGTAAEGEDFLSLLQSLTLPIADLETLPESTPGNPFGALALTPPVADHTAPGIPVVQATLDLAEGDPLLAAEDGGNVHPLGGNGLPLIVAPAAQPVPAQSGHPLPGAADLLRETKVPDAPSSSIRAQVAGTPDAIDDAVGNIIQAPRRAALPATSAPAANDLSIAADPARSSFNETMRDLLRMQSGIAPAANNRSFNLTPGAGAEALADISGPDGYVTDVARASQTGERLLATAPAPASLPLARPAGMPGWDQALGQRVLWMAENGMGQAELRLDPPHLGSLSVRIAMNDDQAQVFFQAQHPAAREALESALPRLREMFADQGLELGDADVDSRDDQQAHSDTNDAGDTQSGGDDNSAGTLASSTARDSASDINGAVPRDEAQTLPNSLIDTYA